MNAYKLIYFLRRGIDDFLISIDLIQDSQLYVLFARQVYIEIFNLPEQEVQINLLRTSVDSGETSTESWRRTQLNGIKRILDQHEKEILEALYQDLGKPQTEAFFEIIALKQELNLAIKNLKLWMRPQKIQIPLTLQPGSAIIQAEPLGCVLIIGPWNYPFSLTLQPLISALAAGNTAVIKPSEHAPSTSTLIKKLITKHLSKKVVQVVEGNGEIAQDLLKNRFDHIFFTGGGEIGKKVMKAAANHLTPVTLELGGKSPAIVIEGADIEVTAKRLIWGKGLNAGQTCIAPDYVLVKENLKLPLIKAMKKIIQSFYGEKPLDSKHLAKIISQHHFQRLLKLLTGAIDNKQIIFGGEYDERKKRISPTLINVSSKEDPLMREELFGPLMPIINIRDLNQAIDEIKLQPKPLALYMFGGNASDQKKLLESTSSGSVCFNDVVMQAGIPELPFGGIGPSGMGRYHGEAGFNTFSNQRSILQKPFWLDIKFRYPPYKLDISFLKNLIR